MVEAGQPARALFIVFDGEADRTEPTTAATAGSAGPAAAVVRLPSKSHFGDEALEGGGGTYACTVVARSSPNPGGTVTCLVLDQASFSGLGGGDGLGARLAAAAAESRRRALLRVRARRLSADPGALGASLEAAAAAAAEACMAEAAEVGGGVVGKADRRLRRLSVGSGMASELPEDLKLGDLEVENKK